MALADRIRTVILEMDGPDYGKQARLAEIAKCGRPVVNHWLSGEQRNINIKHALKLSDALGYEVKWLVEGKGPKKKGEKQVDADESGETLFMLHVTQQEMAIVMAHRAAEPMDRTLMDLVVSKVARTKTMTDEDRKYLRQLADFLKDGGMADDTERLLEIASR